MSPEPDRRGVLVLIVGPSGAGKDTIMRRAQDRLGPAGRISFPRRVVTRPADGFEDNESATPETFAEALRAGAFVLDWQAHGLRYGIPQGVHDALEQGSVVVINGSRGIVTRAREVFGAVRVVLVTAPAAILEARIRARGRDEDAPQRLAREVPAVDDLRPDLIIDNSGSLEEAAQRLLDFLRDLAGCPAEVRQVPLEEATQRPAIKDAGPPRE